MEFLVVISIKKFVFKCVLTKNCGAKLRKMAGKNNKNGKKMRESLLICKIMSIFVT